LSYTFCGKTAHLVLGALKLVAVRLLVNTKEIKVIAVQRPLLGCRPFKRQFFLFFIFEKNTPIERNELCNF
jgi:hypothetical protein